ESKMVDKVSYSNALEDFRMARRRAAFEQLLARFTGRSTNLLDYEQVRQQLRATNKINRGVQDIPLDAIVGSVGRVHDFTRTFLPKHDSDAGRWARVKSASASMTGVPPIEVYRIGDAYFVIDGNHRVSIAREQNSKSIQAYVTEVKTRVPLSPDDDVEQVIAKSRYVEFLEQTNLDSLRPGADLQMTFLGRYRLFLEQIDVHRYFMGIDQQRDISYAEAVAHWYDTVYLPVVQIVRERGLLLDFPGRTEADLYFLIAERRDELEAALGWEVAADTAVTDLAENVSSRPARIISRWGGWLLDIVTPDELEPGPPPGQWRKERVVPRQSDVLFNEILVAIYGEADDWRVLDQAILLAQKEGSSLLGLHVREEMGAEQADQSDPNDDQYTAALKAEFDRRCAAAGVNGRLAIESGLVARQVAARAAYADLVMVALNHPPGTQMLHRLQSGLITLIHRSPRPVLTVPPGSISAINRILLAYNSSPKAQEALFVATYLAARYQVDLTVVSVHKEDADDGCLEYAEAYLSNHGVLTARLIGRQHDNPAQAILETSVAHQCDLIVIGGYKSQPIVHAVLGSNVDELLRESKVPIFISR
ncbi:MAG: universal stress protein, partial [Anaerolineales bacterium]|nr:universal stress protein [Anaerolineales bacterium]